jgi:hypothetical protein
VAAEPVLLQPASDLGWQVLQASWHLGAVGAGAGGHQPHLAGTRPGAVGLRCVVVSRVRAGSYVCTTMEFWAKAQPDFGRADDGDASGATYLLRGIVDEPIPLHRQCRILGVSPALDASMASGDGVHDGGLGRPPFLKASLKNH